MAIRKFSRCPRCGSPLGPTESWLGGPSTFWLECSKCNTFVDTYIPMPHQEAVHKDTHKLIGNFGGYGTGKSLTDFKDLEKHLLITRDANAMVTANISYQYENTIKKELEKDIPKAFVADYSVKNQTMTLLNGAVVSYRPLDDPNKLRSNNLTYWIIIEGSEAVAEAFHQLKTRLRNNAATKIKLDEKGDPVYITDEEGRSIPVIEYDWRKGIVESNPDAGWIKQDLLLVSDKINQYGKANDNYEQNVNTIDPSISSHISTTHVNAFLPNDYIDMISRNKPEWWVNRFVNSSFLYAEGLVYPNARKCIIPHFDINIIGRDWLRIVAFDYGLSDNAVFLFGAIDDQAGILYIYKEIVMNNNNIEELANAFKKGTEDIAIGGWYCQPIIDPKSNKRDFNKKDLASHFADYGIMFKPGHVGLDARILRLNTYIETGRLKIFDSCTYFIDEILDYKFEERTLNNNKRDVKPKDKNNHAINPAEWMAMELPSDPKLLTYGVFNRKGDQMGVQTAGEDTTPWQFRTETTEDVVLEFGIPDYTF